MILSLSQFSLYESMALFKSVSAYFNRFTEHFINITKKEPAPNWAGSLNFFLVAFQYIFPIIITSYCGAKRLGN